MRYPAALVAGGLLGGAACGLIVPEPSFVLVAIALGCSAACAIAGCVRRDALLLGVSAGVGFFCGGVLMSSAEWRRASQPPLRTAFEELARTARVEAAREARRMPEDDEAFAVVEGTLRADAAPGASGVSLSVAVDRLHGRAGGGTGRAQLREPEQQAGGEVMRAAGSPTAGGIVVTVAGSLALNRLDDWRSGRRVRLPVQLRRPSRYLDPGVPDHERALALRGTTLVGTTKSGALVELVARGSRYDEALAHARAFARRAIATFVGRWSTRSAAIVAAIVIGDRAGLDEEVERRLQEAGTYHVIAISGGNIAILAGLLLGAFRLAGRLGPTAMLAAIGALIIYAQLVGGGASVERATLMAAVVLGARAFDQRSPPLNALAVVAALIVAVDPLAIADPAFILTFGATFAILVVVPAIATWNRHLEAPPDARSGRRGPAMSRLADRTMPTLVAMLAASAAAEALLFPVGAFVFSRVTFAGLALNFLAIPLMAVAQIAGMSVVPLSVACAPCAVAVGWAAHAGADGLVRSADLVRVVPSVAYRIAPPSSAVVACYYIAAAAAWTLWRWRHLVAGSTESPHVRNIRHSCTAIAIAAALWILINPLALLASRGDGTLHVTFIDVGQGDSAFVVFPRGATMLVDAGGLSASSSFDIGDRVVAPVVRGAGFRRIDYLVLTHGDPDHIGGALSILREFRPREVWEGIPVPRFAPLTTLRLAAQAQGTRWANVYARDAILVDEVEVVARHPHRPDWERQKVRNDDSIVLQLRWRDLSVVLTGDIGREVEKEVASALAPSRLRLLKVPHHGSLTSSSREFLTRLAPQVAVVSAGRNNHFGHPVPEVVERYEAIGTEVFRTDRDGAVTVDSDGYSLAVHTFAGRRLEVR